MGRASIDPKNVTFRVYRGIELIEHVNLSEQVANLLQTCFMNMKGLSTLKTLEEGIGFHDIKDTIWILCFDGETSELFGALTAVKYHNGLYMCNFSVFPHLRKIGLGLFILERASQYAVENGRNRLIGNADNDNRYIINYYRSLGAEIIETGVAGNSSALSSIRLFRDIPDTTDGVTRFFSSLRKEREIRRQNTYLKRARGFVAVAFCLFIIYGRSRRGIM